MTNTEKIRTVLFSTLVPTIIIIILVTCIAIAVNYISKMDLLKSVVKQNTMLKWQIIHKKMQLYFLEIL